MAHSGYDISLAEGKHQGVDTPHHQSIQTSLGPHEELPVESPPSTHLSFPSYFSRVDHRKICDPHLVSLSASRNNSDTSMANPIQLVNVLGDDNNKGLTAEHILHMERSTALLLAKVWKDCDESGDEELTINKPALAVTIPALDDSSPSPDKAPHLQLANVWCDVDNNVDDEELSNIYETPTAPADIQPAHL